MANPASPAHTVFLEPFEAIGTVWHILIDEPLSAKETQELSQLIKQHCLDFQSRFSRFTPGSEIWEINHHPQETRAISPELAEILQFGITLREDTNGAFDPNITQILEGHGYDHAYSFKKDETKLQQQRGSFTLEGNILHTNGSVQIDLGGWGKGIVIDQVAQILQTTGLPYFLIDAGRDFFGTSKQSGEPWQIGLEHPLDPESALGSFALKNQALACSGTQKRRFGEFHHLINTKTGNSQEGRLSIFVSGKTATTADALATAIFVSPEEIWPQLTEKYDVEFGLVNQELHLQKSRTFSSTHWTIF